MVSFRVAAFTVMAAVLGPPAALAQQTAPSKEPFRRWDAGGGVEFRFDGDDDAEVRRGGYSSRADYYWTPHLASTLAVFTAASTTNYGGGSVAGGYQFNTSTVAPAGVTAAATYQFFQNVFVHPYLMAGLRAISVTDGTTTYQTRPPYQTVTTSSGQTLRAGPIVSGGFKSYFDNGRAFMRTEVTLVNGAHGAVHAVVHVGAGVEF